jgi:hypothetical protein
LRLALFSIFHHSAERDFVLILFKPNDIANQDGALVNEAFGDRKDMTVVYIDAVLMVGALYLVG